jgi:hypothetical protein
MSLTCCDCTSAEKRWHQEIWWDASQKAWQACCSMTPAFGVVGAYFGIRAMKICVLHAMERPPLVESAVLGGLTVAFLATVWVLFERGVRVARQNPPAGMEDRKPCLYADNVYFRNLMRVCFALAIASNIAAIIGAPIACKA